MSAQSISEREYPLVAEKLLFDTPSCCRVGRYKEEAGEDYQDLKLRPSQPWEEARKVDITPVVQRLVDETDIVLMETNTKKPKTLPAPSIVAAHALPAGCSPVGSTSTTNALSTAWTMRWNGSQRWNAFRVARDIPAFIEKSMT